MEREVMDGGDKRGTASGAGGIRVSDFPLKLFYKLCKRFSLQQTLEHTRERTFPVEHSQLKAARIFPLQGHDQGASRWELSERVSFGSELPATPWRLLQQQSERRSQVGVRRWGAVLQSATEAVLEDRTQSSPTPGKAVLGRSWHVAGPCPHPCGLRGDHHLISPASTTLQRRGRKPHMQEALAPSVKWDARVTIKEKPCVRY